MFVDTFIKRPVLASVAAIIIVLTGAIAIPTLPVAQYPNVSPPQVVVTANYTGANAEVVEQTVTSILEREINGIEGIRYMNSVSANTGTSTITITFELDRDQDIAAVDVQNRVQTAQARLPTDVTALGVTISKESSNLVMVMGLYAEDGVYDDTYVSNYADLFIRDALKRLNGVSNVVIFGERQYAMRVWLDPQRLAQRGLAAQDVVNALREQNLQVGAGQIGLPPTTSDQQYQLSIVAKGRLSTAEEFEDITISASDDGTLIKIRDIGRVELGAENYSSFVRFNRIKGVGIGIFPLPGANFLDVSRVVKQEMAVLERNFPPGLNYRVAFDTTDFVQESIRSVVITLFQAITLVVLIIFVFLQDWRTTIIPVVTIPVSLIGTFIFVKAFGFSLNSLTMFGLTLATGMVVDDAIVIIENISRYIQDEGMRPIEAASVAMSELFGAVIATSLVLMAVFIPVAFFPGTTGLLYRQFALTIAFAITISTFNALTLTPSLSALLLRRSPPPDNRFFNGFNWLLDQTRNGYAWLLQRLVNLKALVMVVFAALLALTYWLYTVVPQSFLPTEDQGYLITLVIAPEGVSLNYTEGVIEQAEDILQNVPEITNTFGVGAFGFNGNAPHYGVIFSTLKPWSERKRPDQSMQSVINKVRGPLFGIQDALVITFPPPAIQGLGSVGGFTFQLQDRANLGFDVLAQSMGAVLGRAAESGKIVDIRPNFSGNTPQLNVEIDRDRANALQVPVDDILNTLQINLGSQFVNEFNSFGQSYRVFVQADQQFRSEPNDINQLYVRSLAGELIPLGNLVNVTPTIGPSIINRYNLFRAIQIDGSPAPGVSSGEAIRTMEQIAAEVLPNGISYEWSGLSLEEIKSGGQAPIIFALGLVFVFLVLAAQYESYITPTIIMFTVPLAIMGALLAVAMRSFTNDNFANDIYVQIGLVMLIGLASKNAILIVEFADQLQEKGLPLVKAALEASQQRLRPILMTAFSTIVGLFPLVIATGAGAASRQSLGTAVVGGMIASTFLSLFLVPILYIVVGRIVERFKPKPPSLPEATPPEPEPTPVESE
ncbi:transporter, hydrophobe/amphiphile efflux-1 (HAE1) family [Thalassoporum mexicanum PCC 7367]|uniref:efflux RND transporter permease subunit n=1 Tax=Thalassoporum mexicanum TaxID=3457544 RepID=UPI00029F900D|nr:efflux RND transporter permease subunit [Pseudanabaena sp. PCC 7367]AFY70826.1 transporter, hydrophobe/amphiphile efflux-1 (HAE1) family [Pseudanabaena sp. PCC 7367]